MSSIVPNFKNPYKCREEDMKPLEDSIRENGIIQPLMVRKDDKADVYEIISGHRRYLAATRLIPDLISIVKVDDEYQFIIFDAKYYNIQLEENKKLRGQPGIESITKQYLYQLAYQPFVEEHQIKTVRNCFLMPTNGNDVVVKGTASLAMLSSLGLQDIQIRLLPAQTMYKHYIENTKMDISILQL